MSDKLRPVVLEGGAVRLEPLSVSHVEELCDVGLDEELWRWIPYIVRTKDDMSGYVAKALREQEEGMALPFAVIDRESGKAIGSTRYLNVDLHNKRVEIGSTWIGSKWQRTRVNTEMKYLLLKYAFETLHLNRVELKTDALNQKSRDAIRRIGAKEEGTLRKHVVTYSGRVRDTVYYSILDVEWPDVRRNLEARLTEKDV